MGRQHLSTSARQHVSTSPLRHAPVRGFLRGVGNAGSDSRVAAEEEAAAVVDVRPDQPGGGDAAAWISALFLIAANFAPLVAVTFFGWDLFDVVFLYWLENAVVGFYNILKLIVVTGPGAIFTVPFFCLHYGAFMAAHGSLLFAFFGHHLHDVGFFNFWALWHAPPVQAALARAHWPFFALFVSHGVSFLVNFIGRAEYRNIGASMQMEGPYKRLLVMHVTVVIGGATTAIFGSPDFLLVVLVLLKMAVDLRAHRKEHAPRAAMPEPAGAGEESAEKI